MAYATTLFKQDLAKHRSRTAILDVLKAQRATIKTHPLKLLLDYRKIARGPGELSFQEYVNFRLYDRTLYPGDDSRLRFLSDRLHWPLCYQCSDRNWNATTEDKWIAELLLREASIPTTRTLAIVGGSLRSYGRTPHFIDPKRFAAFMAEQSAPVFAKINGGLGSEGATRIVPLGDGRYDIAKVGEASAIGLFNFLRYAPSPYLLQEELVQHPDVAALAGDRIATVRVISFVIAGKVHTPLAVLKMPGSGNIADNYWRKGNLVADIDEKTGMIRRVVRGIGPELEELSHHPDTGAAMTGVVLPMWSELLDVIKATGRLYAPVGYQSQDIAITENGPTVVEVNTGSSFMLPQIARGEGFLSNEVLDLFMRAGAQIDTKKLKL